MIDQGRELLDAYLNGEDLTEEQAIDLSAWMCLSKDNAAQAVELMHLNQSMADLVRSRSVGPEISPERDSAVVLALAELARLHEEEPNRPIDLHAYRKSMDRHTHESRQRTRVKARLAIAGGLAAVLAMGVGIALMVGLLSQPAEQIAQAPEAQPVIATLTDQWDARWESQDGSVDLPVGASLYPGQHLTLNAGFAEVTTRRGARLSIEGPCTFEVTDDDNALRITHGKLTAEVPPAATGFTVYTPSARVVDIGTAFGVNVLADEVATRVHVFEGEVRAALAGMEQDEAVSVTAGQAVQIDTEQVASVAYEPSQFVKEIQVARDEQADRLRPRVVGRGVDWLSRTPADLRAGQQTSKTLQIYLEQAGIQLDQPVAVDIDRDYPWPGKQLASRTVAAGERVDVYLLHLDTPGNYSVTSGRNGDYTIHFDRPILGVIGHESTLRATDRLLGVPGVAYPLLPDDPAGRKRAVSGIDSVQTFGKPDFAEVSDDGMSLRVRLNSSTHLDQIRVLVRAAE